MACDSGGLVVSISGSHTGSTGSNPGRGSFTVITNFTIFFLLVLYVQLEIDGEATLGTDSSGYPFARVGEEWGRI